MAGPPQLLADLSQKVQPATLIFGGTRHLKWATPTLKPYLRASFLDLWQKGMEAMCARTVAKEVLLFMELLM